MSTVDATSARRGSTAPRKQSVAVHVSNLTSTPPRKRMGQGSLQHRVKRSPSVHAGRGITKSGAPMVSKEHITSLPRWLLKRSDFQESMEWKFNEQECKDILLMEPAARDDNAQGVLLRWMSTVPFLENKLSAKSRDALCRAIRGVEVEPDTRLYTLGERGDCIYVTFSGQVRLDMPGGTRQLPSTKIIQTSHVFGTCILEDHEGRRKETATTRSYCVLGVITLEDFQAVTRQAELRSTAEKLGFLSAFPIFTGVSTVRLQQISSMLKPVICKAGTVVFRQGDPADCMMLIQRGLVLEVKHCKTRVGSVPDTLNVSLRSLDRPPTQPERQIKQSAVVGELTAGQFFGQEVMDDACAVRQSTFLCRTEVHLLRLSAYDLHHVVDAHTAAAMRAGVKKTTVSEEQFARLCRSRSALESLQHKLVGPLLSTKQPKHVPPYCPPLRDYLSLSERRLRTRNHLPSIDPSWVEFVRETKFDIEDALVPVQYRRTSMDSPSRNERRASIVSDTGFWPPRDNAGHPRYILEDSPRSVVSRVESDDEGEPPN